MIYVDPIMVWPHARGRYKAGACHMLGDTLPELHAFAKKIGCKPSWFHRRATLPHYDLTQEWREKAISAGAVEISSARELVRRVSQP